MATADTPAGIVPTRLWAGFWQSFNNLSKQSLRGRVTLAVGVLFFLSIAVVSLQSIVFLRNELRNAICLHNTAFLKSLSQHVTAEVGATQQHLSDFASVFPREGLADPAAADAFLATRVGLPRIFDGGLQLYSPSGVLMAGTPGPKRAIRDPAERTALAVLIATRQPQISRPYGRAGDPAGPKIAFFAKIETDGHLVGILEGVLNLKGHNVISSLPRTYVGNAGYVFLADRQGLIIAHPDPRRLMTRLSEPQDTLPLESLLAGHAVSGETYTVRGTPMLTSIRRLPVTGWLVGINLPESEVFSPVRAVERYTFVDALAILAIVLLAMSWIMRRLMEPLDTITGQVREISRSGHVKGQRIYLRSAPQEIATLANSFNNMLRSMESHREALSRRERRFRTLIEDSSDIIAVMDTHGILTFISPSASALGYSAEQMRTRPVFDFLHPDDIGAARATLRCVLEKPGRTETLDCRIVRSDGSLERYETIIRNRICDIDIRGIVLSARNVTERRAAENAVRIEEQRLRVALRCANIAVFNQDCDLRYTWSFNTHSLPYAEALIGKADEEVLLPDSAAKAMAFKRQVLETGQGDRVEMVIESNGQERNFILAVDPLHGPDNEITGIAGAVLDITEQRRTEKLLRHAQRMEAFGNLAGGIAHDFNNVLGIVLANLECIRAAVPERADVKRFADNALTAAGQGESLTRNLLAFARDKPLEPELLNLNALLGEFVDMLHPMIGPAIDLSLDIDPQLWPCEIDAGELRNAVLNLVVNARDAMPDGGRVIIRARNVVAPSGTLAEAPRAASGDFVQISIIDTGHGMTPEIAGRAFDPFFTTKDVGKGTGLGLSMVYGFARQSGGHAAIASKAGAGTTLSLYLPRATALTSDQKRDVWSAE